MYTKRFYQFIAIVLALIVIGLLLARSLTPRMEGMGPTGTMPMSQDSSDTMPGMDMQGMDRSGNDMNSQEQTPTNP